MKTIFLTLAAVFVAAAAIGVAMAGDDDRDTARGASATAPISPPGVPASRACATDRPGEGDEVEEARTVQLPLPPPGQYRVGSPERAVAEFMDAWHDRAWDRMAVWASPSWLMLTRGDRGRLLRKRYGAFRLRGWTVLETERDGSVARLRLLVAHRDVRPRIDRERLLFVVTREDRSGKLTGAGGRWGVLLSEKPDADAACPADE